jgi:hypothetical protein
MSNVQELETITDDRLVSAIRGWRKANADIKNAEKSIAQAQRVLDQTIERHTETLGAWRDLVGELDGAGVEFEGEIFPPWSENDGDTFPLKRLLGNGSPDVADTATRTGHASIATPTQQCQCTSEMHTVAGIPDDVTYRGLWLVVVRRAIAAWNEAKAWDKELDRVCKIATAGMELAKSRRSWDRLDSLTGVEVFQAQEWLAGCILTYHGLIDGPDDMRKLDDNWTAVGLEVDGVTYLVRGNSDGPYEPSGIPTLEVTIAGSVELLTG